MKDLQNARMFYEAKLNKFCNIWSKVTFVWNLFTAVMILNHYVESSLHLYGLIISFFVFWLLFYLCGVWIYASVIHRRIFREK